MLIGVDICNTIANVNYELFKKFNISLKQYPAPEVPGDFFLSPGGLQTFMKARPFYQAQETLWQMVNRGYRIVYVTSRPELAEFVTKRWLKVNKFPKGRVEFVPSTKKANIAQSFKMAAFFDDDPTVIKDLITKNIPNIFVKTTPYNRYLAAPSVFHFRKWGQLNLNIENILTDIVKNPR